MAYEFRLPDLGEGLTEAEIARWLVGEGDDIDEDQPLVEVQTDKTTVEIPSPRAGTVLKILVEEGDVAAVGAVLVVIGEEGEQLLRAVDSGTPARGEPPTEPLVAVVPADPAAAVRATPAVRQLARELGVELVGLPGSGPGGRIVEEDVRGAAATSRRARGPARPGQGHPSRDRRAGHARASRGPRRDVRRGMRLHRHRPRPGSCRSRSRLPRSALRRFPELNARLDGDEIVLLDRIDVGVAVQTDDGLVVPVVRGCERLSVEEIAAEVDRLAEAARAGRLTADELRDSTFTITSAGKLGGVFVTPLVNHPEVAILGLHRVADRPVVRDGQVVVRRIGNVSVSFDHRVVDGARAAAFCLDVIDRLQSGARHRA